MLCVHDRIVCVYEKKKKCNDAIKMDDESRRLHGFFFLFIDQSDPCCVI